MGDYCCAFFLLEHFRKKTEIWTSKPNIAHTGTVFEKVILFAEDLYCFFYISLSHSFLKPLSPILHTVLWCCWLAPPPCVCGAVWRCVWGEGGAALWCRSHKHTLSHTRAPVTEIADPHSTANSEGESGHSWRVPPLSPVPSDLCLDTWTATRSTHRTPEPILHPPLSPGRSSGWSTGAAHDGRVSSSVGTR